MTDFQKRYQEHVQGYQSSKLHKVTQQRDDYKNKYEITDSWRLIWKVLFLMAFAYIVGSSIGGWL
jgi:hypothetical protein